MPPSTPFPSATIILVRDYEDELQVYLLRRNSKSSFMAGNYVFPGGMVDEDDQDETVWPLRVDMDSQALKRRFGDELTQTEILTFGVAAIRETYEEAGVRLWETPNGDIRALERLDCLREQHKLNTNWLKVGAQTEKWRLSFSQLFRWAYWITPVVMKRRFDTRFYVAVLPKGQTCTPDNRETTHGLWTSPSKALFDSRAGKIPLGPPTVTTLHQLLKYQTVGALFAEFPQRPWGKPILPRLIATAKGSVFLMPWDPEYSIDQLDFDFDGMQERVLPVGTDFSRLWETQGICQPVRV